jgi:restriction endonuclease S subunit
MRIKLLEKLSYEITSGMVISRVEAKEKSVRERVYRKRVLTLRAISCGVIDSDETDYIEISKQIKQDKLTQVGDIVIKMNKPYDSVFIENAYEGYLIPSFCCVIKNTDFSIVDPYYLVGYLNSAFAKEYLITANGSSAASLLKIKDIKKLPIPLPEMKEQKAIGEVFRICCERQLLLKNMMKHEMRLAENIILDAAREVFNDDK